MVLTIGALYAATVFGNSLVFGYDWFTEPAPTRLAGTVAVISSVLLAVSVVAVCAWSFGSVADLGLGEQTLRSTFGRSGRRLVRDLVFAVPGFLLAILAIGTVVVAPIVAVVALVGASVLSMAWVAIANAAIVLGEFCDVGELHLRWVLGIGQRVDPCLLHRWDAAQGTKDHPVGERRGATDVIAVRLVAVVAGREEEVLAARSLVGARDTHVGHVPEPEIIHDAQGDLR